MSPKSYSLTARFQSDSFLSDEMYMNMTPSESNLSFSRLESHLTPNAVHISDDRPMHTIQMSDPVGASLLWRILEYDSDLPGASLCVLRTNTGKAEDNENPQ